MRGWQPNHNVFVLEKQWLNNMYMLHITTSNRWNKSEGLSTKERWQKSTTTTCRKTKPDLETNAKFINKLYWVRENNNATWAEATSLRITALSKSWNFKLCFHMFKTSSWPLIWSKQIKRNPICQVIIPVSVKKKLSRIKAQFKQTYRREELQITLTNKTCSSISSLKKKERK